MLGVPMAHNVFLWSSVIGRCLHSFNGNLLLEYFMATDASVLVIGATGGIGSETALAFSRRGYCVRAFHRRPEEAASKFARLAFDWVKGDAMYAAEVAAAVEGARYIVYGANPPMYRNWPKLVLPMLESTIAAAKASGARILFPGSIYNFPLDGPLVLREDTPQRGNDAQRGNPHRNGAGAAARRSASAGACAV
jgi:nucleoside-diphosphate-sugar epimerase